MTIFVRVTTLVLAAVTAIVGVWAFGWPDGFSDAVGFTPHRHFVHDVGAFQIGIAVTLLLALIWADALAVALAGYAAGAAVHTAAHVADADLGGSPAQTWSIALLCALAVAALIARYRSLGWVLGTVDAAPAPFWAPLNHQKTVAVTTYRRDGTPVATPVSVAVDGRRAYMRSFENAGKSRRLRRNPSIALAPSTRTGTPTGPAIEATARRLTGIEDRHAGRLLARKHPLLHGVLVPLTHRLARPKYGHTVHFELTPVSLPPTGHTDSAMAARELQRK
jgi:PPOX class probable F420-dependent enzyme